MRLDRQIDYCCWLLPLPLVAAVDTLAVAVAAAISAFVSVVVVVVVVLVLVFCVIIVEVKVIVVTGPLLTAVFRMVRIYYQMDDYWEQKYFRLVRGVEPWFGAELEIMASATVSSS